MLGWVTRHMLPHLPGVPHRHVHRPFKKKMFANFNTFDTYRADIGRKKENSA